MAHRSVVGWTLLCMVFLWALPGWGMMPPQGLTVMGATDSSVDLTWAPPVGSSGGEFYNVYRNGKLMGPGPVPGTFLHVPALAPSTPSTYTVEVADPSGAPLSDMSNRVGAVTMDGVVLLVPEQFGTIQEALWIAGPGTTIVVAAGTYREPGLWFGAERVTLKGAGAGATVIDLDGQFLDLTGFGDHSVTGVSIVNGPVLMAREDTLSASALLEGPFESVAGGGFVTNCVFDRLFGMPAFVGPGEHLTIANSIVLAPDPIYTYDGPSSVLLLHNDFVQWPEFEWQQYPGEGNFSAPPDFECGYSLMPWSPCVNAGIDVGLEASGAAPDVGACEFGLPLPPFPPQNFRVEFAGSQDITLSWDPVCGGVDVEVFRNGQSVGFAWGGFPPFGDWGLPPETPATYTARTVDHYRGSASALSHRVGARTLGTYQILRVPQDRPTIQAAIETAGPGTRIDVAPGTYSEPLSFAGKNGITLACQDANACTIDLRSAGTNFVDLYPWGGAVTVSGFTIRGATVFMGPGDTLVNSVVVDTPYEGVYGGGLIANCVISGTVGVPGFLQDPGMPAVIANSIMGPYWAIESYDIPTSFLPEPLVLLHNNIVNDYWLAQSPPAGAGNFSAWPNFAPPGPPDTYYTEWGDPGVDAGFEFDLYPMGSPPDVGAFEVGQPITARPPTELVGVWNPLVFGVDLSWVASPDDPGFSPAAQVWDYRVYRSEVPGEPVYTEAPYTLLPPGSTSFQDTAVVPGITYYYQVVAFSGYGMMGNELLTAPTAVASVAVTVNEPPLAIDDFYSLDEDAPLVVAPAGVLANDTGTALTAVLETSPTFGVLFLYPDGAFEYQPNADFNGPDQFTYRAIDNLGQSASAVVTLNVNPVNDAPVALPDSASTAEDTAVAIAVLANDSDADGDPLTVTGITQGTNGTVTTDGTTVTYTPTADWSGTDTFSYTVADGNGGSDTASVTVNVTSVNDAPVADPDSASTAEDTAVTIAVLANDSDADGDTLTVTAVTQGANGTVTTDGTTVTYTPAADWSGTDSFSYTVADGNGGTSTATVTVIVTPVNDAPVASNDSGTTTAGSAVTIAVLTNDSDADGDALTVSGVTQGANGGSVATDGTTVTYTPTDGFHGGDLFTYTVSDGNGGSAVAQVNVTVVPRYLRVATLTAVATTSRNVTHATAMATVVDEVGAALPGVVVSGHWEGLTTDTDAGTTDGSGTLSLDSDEVRKADGVYTFVIDAVTATNYLLDSAGSVLTASVQYPELAANQPPVAVDDAGTTELDTAITIGVLANDSDPDGDSLTVTVVTDPANGSVVLNPDQTVTYTPASGFLGADAFSYTVDDGRGGTAQATVQVTVSDPGASQLMHVADIAMDLIPKKVTKAKAAVLVVDAGGAPVVGVSVNGVWSGAVSGSAMVVTDASGLALFTSPGIKAVSGQTFTFTVTNAGLGGWVYDFAANGETSDFVLVP